MTKTPLISVMVPNYNHGRFIGQAIETILGQTYPHFEVLVTDDGSSDNSRRVIEHFASRDARVKPVFFSANRGSLIAAQDARDRGTGDLLYGSSADDYIESPHFFEMAVEGLRRFPQAAGYYGTARTLSTETGHPIGTLGAGTRRGYVPPDAALAEFLQGRLFIPGTSSIWRRALVDETGPYDLVLGPLADYFANHALAARYGVVFAGEPVVCSRVSESQQSYSSRVTLESTASGLELFETRLREWTGNPPSLEGHWRQWRANQAMGAAIRFSRFQHAVARIKYSIRSRAPRPLFVVMNVLWRQTVGRGQRLATRWTPAYRRLHGDSHVPRRS